MADEPTAIRHPKRGKAHRIVDLYGFEVAACNQNRSAEGRNLTERVPLSQTAPEDRCRTCWPTTKDVTP